METTIGICHSHCLEFVETDGDALTGIGLAPNRNFLATLNHHTRLEELGQLNLGTHGKTEAKGKSHQDILLHSLCFW